MTALAKAGEHETAIVAVGDRGIQIRGLNELMKYSRSVHQSGLFPQFKTEAACAMAIETCLELGLKPMLAMPKITVINGKVGLMGDLALAVVRSSKACEYVKSGIVGDGDARHAWVESKRKDTGEIKRAEFSVADAKRAGLWGKQGPWAQYPDRQLYYRALGFNLRDNFSDKLHGLTITEELTDYQPIEVRTVASTATEAPAHDPLMDELVGPEPAADTEPETPTLDVIDAPVDQPNEADPDAAAQKTIDAFKEIGVSRADLEAHLGRLCADWGEQDYAILRKYFKKCRAQNGAAANG